MAVDCVVEADVNIVCVLAEHGLICLGNVGEGLVGRGSYRLGVAVALSLLKSLLCPLTGYDVISLVVLVHEVEGNHGELCGAAALKKENLVVIGDIHYFSEESLSVLDDLVIGLAAVRHLHNALAAALVVEHLCGCFFKYRLG